jgi:hypothetical protein
MLKVEVLLNWIIILLCLILAIVLFVTPKDDCDTCKFDGQSGKEWFNDYSNSCLKKYNYGESNPNMPTWNPLNLSIQS